MLLGNLKRAPGQTRWEHARACARGHHGQPTPKIQPKSNLTLAEHPQLRTHKINLLGTIRVLPGNLIPDTIVVQECAPGQPRVCSRATASVFFFLAFFFGTSIIEIFTDTIFSISDVVIISNDSVLNDKTIDDNAMNIQSGFSLSPIMLLLNGILIWVLSHILIEGMRIKKENELTI